jgi:hypothetical protein
VTIVGLIFFGLLAATAGLNPWPGTTPPPALPPLDVTTSPSTVQLGAAFLGVADAVPREFPKRDPDTGDVLVDPKTGKPQLEPARVTGVPAKDPQGKPITPPAREQAAYLLPFEIVSVHLTVVLIGAAYLARAKRRREVSA